MDSETVDKAASDFDKAFQDAEFRSTVYDIVDRSNWLFRFLYGASIYGPFLKAALWMLLMMIKRLRHQNYKLATFSVRPAAEQDEAYGVYKISTSFTSDLLLHTDDTVLNKVLDETLQEHKRRIVEHAAQLKSLKENNGEGSR